jgi:RNA polymerase sigma-70 factor (ECF subfamily)
LNLNDFRFPLPSRANLGLTPEITDMDDDRKGEVPDAGPETRGDDPPVMADLFNQLHAELYRLAARAMAGERADHTLQPTALLHEVWLRLFRAKQFDPDTDRSQIIREATRAMRQILVDHARHRAARKRGGQRQRVPLDAVLDYCEKQRLDVQSVHEALNELALKHERQASVMTLRFICRFTVQEVASQLDISVGSVESDFRLARAWLRRRLKGSV